MGTPATRVLFWGSGKMSAAIARGLKRGRLPMELSFYSPSGTSAQELASVNHGRVFELGHSAPFDYVVLGFKPQQLGEAAPVLAREIERMGGPTLISILAGVRMKSLSEYFSKHKIVRMMPNTPIDVGAGLLGWVFNEEHGEHLRSHILETFKSCGLGVALSSEDELDRYTAIAGSGPAYIFEFARILFENYLSLGLPGEHAHKIISELFLGSAKLMNESELSFEELRNAVTSKGGVTARALDIFSEHNFSSTVKLALEKNIERSRELARS